MAMQKDKWLGLKSVWLGLSVKACGQGLGSDFRFADSELRVKV